MATKAELEQRAEELGVAKTGTKDELEARIAEAEAGQDEPVPAAADVDRKATGDPAGFVNAPGHGADAQAFTPTPDPEASGFVLDLPQRRPAPADAKRASERGVFVDREGRRRVVAAGDVIPDGWTEA